MLVPHPALERREWLEGYLSGAAPWPAATTVARELRVLELACGRHSQEALVAMHFTRGFLAGLVAIWSGVSLHPIARAVSIRPYSKE